jgi:hypothetical protein
MSSGQSGAYSTGGASRKRKGGAEAWLARMLFENFWLKILSLAVALGFYAFLHSASTAQRTLQVSIVADMPPSGTTRQLITPIPEAIRVTVEGPRQQIDNLESSKLDPIPLNLRAAQDEVVHFTPEMIAGLPPGARVTRIIPESLQIRWENVIQLPLDVQVPMTGQLAAGLELKGAVEVRPARINASGAESQVRSIQLARADPFDLGGLGEGRHVRSLALAPAPPGVTYSERTVEATLEVARKLVSHEFEVKVQVVGLARAKTEPGTVRVVVEGLPDRVDRLRPDAIVARVEPKVAPADAAQPGNAWLPVLVDLPEDTKVTVEPAKVLVKW